LFGDEVCSLRFREEEYRVMGRVEGMSRQAKGLGMVKKQ
jgi:hypothetical protein